jgi:hypothetical protein
MQFGAVLSRAEGFAHAIRDDDPDAISSYLCQGLQMGFKSHIDNLVQTDMPSPLKTNVLFVAPVGNRFDARIDQFLSVISFTGAREEVVVRAVWIEEAQGPTIYSLQIVQRTAKNRTPSLAKSEMELTPEPAA